MTFASRRRYLLRIFRKAPIVADLGAALRLPGPGRAEVRVPFRRSLLQATGVVHGAMIAFAADTAGYFAAAGAAGDGDVATSEFKIHFLEPVLGPFRSEARIIKAGRRLVITEMRVYARRRSLVSLALGTYVRIVRP